MLKISKKKSAKEGSPQGRNTVGKAKTKSPIKLVHNCSHLTGGPQCARTDLNKRFLPKPMTTTG